MASAPDPGDEIRPLNKLFYKLCQQLNEEDVRSMKNLLRARQLPRVDEEKVETATDLFHHLENRGCISCTKLELLTEMFETMNKQPLIEILNNFREDRAEETTRKIRKETYKMDASQILPPNSDEKVEEVWYEVPKIIQDPIHGTVEIDPVYMEIIDTPEFQRLREIKQLGTVNFVYPGAVHTRFEHSIGTCHMALRMVRHFKSQENLGITKEEELCVGLAALCHDLGHGPFSHLFEYNFLPRFKPKGYEDWSHELGSIKIFEEMVKKYDLKAVFKKKYRYEINGDDIHMIKEMIYGPLAPNVKSKKDKYKRVDTYSAPHRHFLYEIVSNKTNEIDVDKWDYFARDSYYLGVSSPFLHDRFIKCSRVLKDARDSSARKIFYRDKEVHSAYEMFHTRYRLYRMAYFHPVSIALDLMICDALVIAAPHLRMRKSNGEKFYMHTILQDMEAYLSLNDTILSVIRYSYDNTKLEEARNILERIQNRKLYKLVKKINLENDARISENDVKLDDIVKYAVDKNFTSEDMCFKIITLDYGMGDKNPVGNVMFYSKRDQQPRQIPQDEVSCVLPKTFQERKLFFYVKNSENKQIALQCVDEWAQHQSWISKPTLLEGKDTEP